jgi:hypothetical protein
MLPGSFIISGVDREVKYQRTRGMAGRVRSEQADRQAGGQAGRRAVEPEMQK